MIINTKPDTKNEKGLADNTNHQFYIALTDYLRPLFTRPDDAKLDKLKKSAYQYFCTLLTLDKIMDNPKNGKTDFFQFISKLEKSTA